MSVSNRNLAINNTRLPNKTGGFTLIEMVLVIIIIGLLLTGAVFGYLGYERAANNRIAQQNYATLMTAKVTWCAQNQGQGTPALSDLGPYINNGSTIAATDLTINGVIPSGTLVTAPKGCNVAGDTLTYAGTTFGAGASTSPNITCTSISDSPTVNDGICDLH